VTQATISAVERGHAQTLSPVMLQRIAGVVDARVRLVLSWRGGDLDRLTDERHARLASEVARLLRSMGWEVQAEVTFAIGREGGSIDLLAWHAATRTLLVVETKTVLASSEELLRQLDTKTRLGPVIAARFGWRPQATGRMVVLPASRTNRRHVLALATLVGPDVGSIVSAAHGRARLRPVHAQRRPDLGDGPPTQARPSRPDVVSNAPGDG